MDVGGWNKFNERFFVREIKELVCGEERRGLALAANKISQL